MAEAKIKKAWYKQWWVITLFVIIGLSILGNLSGQNNSPDLSSHSANIPASVDSCKSLIPERIKLQCNIGPLADHYNNTGRNTCTAESLPQYWNDGTLITGTVWFEDGWRQGENINFFYPGQYLGYEKVPVDSEGNVGEKISYRIMFILDPKDKTSGGYKVKSYKCCQSTKYNPCNILSESYKDW